MNNPPSFYAIIPANVRYCKDLEPAAKLFYGEITALCNQEGYCWATNKYFCELYGVDERTIQRWLSSLSENKFIFIDLNRNGFSTNRKIYISQEMFTMRQKCRPDPTKMSAPPDKNVTHNNTSNNTKNNCSVLSGENPPLPSEIPKHETSEKFHPDGHKFTISKEDVYAEVIRSGKKWNGKIIEEAWKIYRDYGGPVRNWFRWIEGTIENLEKKYESYKKKAKTCQKKVYQEMKKPLQTEEIMTEKQFRTTSPEHSVWSSENGTKEHPLAKLCSELGLKC